VILYFGAEFTKVLARRRGAFIQPSAYAVKMTDQQRAEQGMPRQEHVEEVARRSRPPGQTGGAGRPRSGDHNEGPVRTE
jgi:hypothetical protein